MAAPDASTTLEGAVGGLPLVQGAGLNTNKAVNFSGFQVNTSGVPSAGPTGPTASAIVFNTITAEISGASGSAAILGTAGALVGGPTAAQQDGWMVTYINGTKVWVPVWK